jgi:hypothetical protein
VGVVLQEFSDKWFFISNSVVKVTQSAVLLRDYGEYRYRLRNADAPVKGSRFRRNRTHLLGVVLQEFSDKWFFISNSVVKVKQSAVLLRDYGEYRYRLRNADAPVKGSRFRRNRAILFALATKKVSILLDVKQQRIRVRRRIRRSCINNRSFS